MTAQPQPLVLRVCPCCGTDIAVDAPVMINDFSMNGAGFPLFYQGKKVPLTPNQALVCWGLLKSYPHHLTTMALYERLGSEADDPDNVVKVHVCRIRKILEDMGAPPAIRTVPGMHAYAWDPFGTIQ